MWKNPSHRFRLMERREQSPPCRLWGKVSTRAQAAARVHVSVTKNDRICELSGVCCAQKEVSGGVLKRRAGTFLEGWNGKRFNVQV